MPDAKNQDREGVMPEDVEKAIQSALAAQRTHAAMIALDPKRADNEMWEATQLCKETSTNLTNAILTALAAAERAGEEKERARINSPEIEDFLNGALREARHQRERWGTDHDGQKEPEEWYWLIGYLAGKCLFSLRSGDIDKAKHHAITAAAAMAHWHDAIRARKEKP